LFQEPMSIHTRCEDATFSERFGCEPSAERSRKPTAHELTAQVQEFWQQPWGKRMGIEENAIEVKSDDEHPGVYALGAGGGAAGGAADGLDAAGVQALRDTAVREEQQIKGLGQLLHATPGVNMIGFARNKIGCAKITVEDPLLFVLKAKEMVTKNTTLWSPTSAKRRHNVTWRVFQTLRKAGFKSVQRGTPLLDPGADEMLYFHGWIPFLFHVLHLQFHRGILRSLLLE
jgi:hypothetical protein